MIPEAADSQTSHGDGQWAPLTLFPQRAAVGVWKVPPLPSGGHSPSPLKQLASPLPPPPPQPHSEHNISPTDLASCQTSPAGPTTSTEDCHPHLYGLQETEQLTLNIFFDCLTLILKRQLCSLCLDA